MPTITGRSDLPRSPNYRCRSFSAVSSILRADTDVAGSAPLVPQSADQRCQATRQARALVRERYAARCGYCGGQLVERRERRSAQPAVLDTLDEPAQVLFGARTLGRDFQLPGDAACRTQAAQDLVDLQLAPQAGGAAPIRSVAICGACLDDRL